MSITSKNEATHSSDLLDKNLKGSSINEKLNIVDSKKTTKNKLEKQTKPQICRISNNNDLLSRVRGFLPQIKSANEELNEKVKQQPDELNEFDIENVDGCSKVIEMDVSFVKDLKETALDNFLTELSSDSDSSDSENEIIISGLPERT